jgi:AcrR family transcriptional regulator
MEVPEKRPGRPRDEQLGARRTAEILDVAARLFAARGFGNTDVQTVADQLGVGKGTVYRYFPTKEELFLATVDRGMWRLTEYIDASMNDEDVLKQLEQGIHAYLVFFQDNPEIVELLIQERAAFRDRPKSTYFAHKETNIGKFQDRLRTLIATGRMRDLPVEMITNVMGELVYGTMFTNYFSGQPRSLDEQADEILEVVLMGLLTDKERSLRVVMGRGEPARTAEDADGDSHAGRTEE